MSNTGAFIQKLIDKSRFKTTSSRGRTRRAAANISNRKELLENDPLFRKNTGLPPLNAPPAGTGILSQLRGRILKQQGILQHQK